MKHHRFIHPRRGLTSTLAMLYLILFSTLAIGFAAAVNTSVQVSSNEQTARQAMLAAESGMAMVRYLLGNVNIPHGTPPDQTWNTLCDQVRTQLNGTANLGGINIPSSSSSVMDIPRIQLDSSGAAFSARLTNSGEQIAVRITGTGRNTQIQRVIQMAFARAQRASAIFDYGVASKSAITMNGTAKITGATDAARGSVLSSTSGPIPLTMVGSPSISGDFSYTNPAGANSYGNGSIAGYKSSQQAFTDHIHAGVTPPEFPVVDTSAFVQYVPGANALPSNQTITTDPPSDRKSFTNIRIKANANPHFAAGSVFQGVIYVETPNRITFSGGATIQGVIAVQNNPSGSTSSNSITFTGNVTHQGVETLPESFGNLRKLTGSFLLAPEFDVSFQGNNNNVGGTIVTGAFHVSGNAGANVKGTVINLEDTAVNLTGSSDIVIASTGTTNYPAGVFFGTHYAPLPGTYQELP